MSISSQGPGPCEPPNDCPSNSNNPISFFNGKIQLTEIDIDAGIQGFNHSRRFLNKTYHITPWESVQGWNWAVTEWPYIVRRINEYAPGQQIESIVVKTGGQPIWFNKQDDGTYEARYGRKFRNLLEHVAADGVFRFTAISNGGVEVIDFQDFEQADSVAGLFKSKTDSNGFVTTAQAYGDKCLAELETIRGDTTFSLFYDYSDGLLNRVRLAASTATSSWNIRAVRYQYYDGTTSEGSSRDLKAAITQQPVPASDPVEWDDVSVRYYRYTKDDRHLLTTIVGPTVYMKLKEFGQDVLNMQTSSGGPDLVPQFANNIFVYDDANRVVNEVARGNSVSTGPEGVSYVREQNPNISRSQRTPTTAAEYNTWAWKITEAGFEGYRNIIYTNRIGQELVRIKQSLSDMSRQWIEAKHRDDYGRTILAASPSAVAAIDESLTDLIGFRSEDGSFSGLKADQGLITRTSYYVDTTATATTPGSAEGNLEASYVQQGWMGDLIPEQKLTYLASNSGSDPVSYVIAEMIKFRLPEDTVESRITTSYAYTWYAGTRPILQQRISTFPAVPVEEGGDGVAHTTKEYFDVNGNLIYEMDQRGVINKKLYEVNRSLLVTQILDASEAPSGWIVLPGDHLELQTDFEYDSLGRVIRLKGPEHEALVAGIPQTIRRTEFTCHIEGALGGQTLFGYPVLNQLWRATGYLIALTEDEQVIDPVRIDLLDKCGRVIHTIVSKRTSGSGPLAATDTFLRSDWGRWQVNGYDSRGLIESERIYSNIPAATSGLEGVFENIGVEGLSYDETLYNYAEAFPLLLRKRDAEGTITRMVYDDAGRQVATYVGLNDVGESTTWKSWAPNASCTDLVVVSEREYDNRAAGGESLVTRELAYVNSTNVRQTLNTYDFRSRRMNVLGEEGSYREYGYDNLSQITEVRFLDGSAAGKLVSKQKFFYNNLGQVYEMRIYSADPISGEVGEYLVGRSRYDENGRLTGTTQPGSGGRIDTSEYDNVGRTITAGIAADVSDGSEILEVTIEQVKIAFDAAANAISTTHARMDTGASIAAPTYRSSYRETWFDTLGRTVVDADLGALASVPVRASSPPSRADDILLNEIAYDDIGNVASKTDPLGRVTLLGFDHKGRLVSSIENYVSPGTPNPAMGRNRTYEYSYTPDDQRRELIVVGEETWRQVTTWRFGVSQADSALASNKLVGSKIYADGTVESYNYDRQGTKINVSDAKGTQHRYVYDGLGRLRHDCAVALGSKIYSPVRRHTTLFDARGQEHAVQTHSSANPASPSLINEIGFTYDGFGDLLKHYQAHVGRVLWGGSDSSPVIEYERGGLDRNQNRITEIIYPDGHQYTVHYGQEGGLDDVIGRITSVRELTEDGEVTLVEYAYLGLDFLVRKFLPEPVARLDLWGGSTGVYAGLDGFDRITDHRWIVGEDADLARLQYGYDRGGRRVYRRDSVAAAATQAHDELYTYDGLSQIKSLQRGVLNGSRTALEEDSEVFNEAFLYDAIGNWHTYQQGTPEPSIDQGRTHNEVNELTAFHRSGQWVKPRYDAVGNLTRSPGVDDPNKPYRVDYDAWDRVSRVSTYGTDWGLERVARHFYDGKSRRIRTLLYGEGVQQRTLERYYDEKSREIVVQSGEAPAATPEWNLYPLYQERRLWDLAPGIYLDSLVLRDRDSSGRRYALQDAHFNVVALIDGEGMTQERFSYWSFGTPQFLNAAFDPVGESSSAWELYFAAYPKEFGIGLYYARNRFYHAKLGRWINRDPIQEKGGVNLYAFVLNSPMDRLDHSGLNIDPSSPNGQLYWRFVADWQFWNSGIFAFASASFEFSRIAMLHADRTIPGDWTLKKSEIERIKELSEYKTYRDKSLKSELDFAFIGKPDGTYPWTSRRENTHFSHGTDAYYGFGDARFSSSGSVVVCKGSVTYYATIELDDDFVFRGYPDAPALSPTGVGFRLETHGWTSPFKTTGTWDETITVP